MTARRSIVLALGVALAAAGCSVTTLSVTPPLPTPPATAEVRLAGRVVYDGNREYLPRAVAAAAPDQRVAFRYAYAVEYKGGRTDNGALLFVPPVILSIPGVMGTEAVAVAGRLEVLDGDRLVRAYNASARVEKKPTLMDEGDTYTDMRRRALIAVRDSIDAQLAEDHDALTKVMNGSDR